MPVRVFCAEPPSESGGFHNQPCLEEHAACSAAFTLAWTSELGSSGSRRLNNSGKPFLVLCQRHRPFQLHPR